jgi:hypothetical protein
MDTTVRAVLPLVQLFCASPRTLEVEARYMTPPMHRPTDKPSPVVTVAQVQELIEYLKSCSSASGSSSSTSTGEKGALKVTQLEDVQEMDFYYGQDEEVRNTQQKSSTSDAIVKNKWTRKSKAIMSQLYMVPERPFLVKTTVKSELPMEPLEIARPTMHRAKIRSRFLLQRVKDGGVSDKVAVRVDLTVVRSGASLAEIATTKPIGEIEFELVDMRSIDLAPLTGDGGSGSKQEHKGDSKGDSKSSAAKKKADGAGQEHDFILLTEQEQMQVAHNFVVNMLELQGKPDGSLLMLKEGLGVLIPMSSL